MDKIIIIDDSGIQKELEEFLKTNKKHIRLSSDMEELAMTSNPVLKEIIKRYEEKHKVKIQSKDHVFFYKSSELLRFEAFLSKTIIFQLDGSQQQISEDIDTIEFQLKDFPFIRTHPDHIVNLHYISRISDKASQSIELSDGTHIPVTIQRKNIIIETFRKYFK